MVLKYFRCAPQRGQEKLGGMSRLGGGQTPLGSFEMRRTSLFPSCARGRHVQHQVAGKRPWSDRQTAPGGLRGPLSSLPLSTLPAEEPRNGWNLGCCGIICVVFAVCDSAGMVHTHLLPDLHPCRSFFSTSSLDSQRALAHQSCWHLAYINKQTTTKTYLVPELFCKKCRAEV